MLCDVVLALLITYSDGHVEKQMRQGAPLSQVQAAKDAVAKLKADPAFQKVEIENNIVSVELEVKKMPKQFDCDKDPEAPAGK